MSLSYRFRLEEISKKSGITPDLILHFVSLSWVTPRDAQEKVFDAEDLARIQLIYDLQQRMGVNDEAVPVILHLVDQLNRMHLELKDI